LHLRFRLFVVRQPPSQRPAVFCFPSLPIRNIPIKSAGALRLNKGSGRFANLKLFGFGFFTTQRPGFFEFYSLVALLACEAKFSENRKFKF
jgi:hypothetical protein